MPTRSLRTLMTGLIDYAGLFPPARLSMTHACETYARARMGEYAWMLGRFICPASRLEECSKAAAAVMPGTHATSGYREHADITEPWQISVLVDGTLDEALDAIASFNQRHALTDSGRAVCDAIELKVADPGAIDQAQDELPEELLASFEIPVASDCRGFIAALAGEGAGAKIRTGGITPQAIPSAEQVARFIHACADADVSFKATAGLHHPLRSERTLDTIPGPGGVIPRGVMHGFLNVFIAAALVRAERVKISTTMEVLEERDATRFKFADEFVAWGGHVVETASLARVRETFARAFGSCSFDEPVDDLIALGCL